MTASEQAPIALYAEVLSAYLRMHQEEALYKASYISRACVQEGLGPEEIIAIHGEAVAECTRSLSFRGQALATTAALQFLLEVMIA